MPSIDSASENLHRKKLRKNDDIHQYYTLTKIKEQHMEKFKTTASTYKVTIRDIEVTENILDTLKIMFTAIFKDLTNSSKSTDLVRVPEQKPHIRLPDRYSFSERT
jgi:hypothetical protein